MSSLLAHARARAARPMGSFPRPRLTVVARVSPRAPRIPFIVLVLSVLVGGLVGLLVLNTALQRGAYEVTALQDQSSALQVQQQRLEVEVAALRQPQRVAEEAQHLGMVSTDSPVFLSLATGRIVGTPEAGRRSDQVNVARGGRAAAGSVRSGKVSAIAAGDGTSLTSGPVTVRAPHPPAGRLNAPSGGHQ